MASNHKKEKTPESSVITREPFPNSRKVYMPGQIHNISVGMREISLEDKDIPGSYCL